MNSTDITFPDKRILREAWEKDLEKRPRALPGYREGNLPGGGDIRAGFLKDE